MAIPPALISRAKDLLLFGPRDAALDAVVAGKWDEMRDKLCREYDLFTQTLDITPTAGKSIYSLPVTSTRIFSVIFAGQVLGFTDRHTLDLRDPNWELVTPGQPRYWLHNALPGDVDTPTATVTYREFLIHPAPDGANAAGTKLTVIYENRPADVPRWLEPILLYLTVGQIAAENPNCMQPEKGQWFQNLAELWLEYVRKLMQV